ncbi:diguanylate cyclase domain-containing protein [Agarivorans sp. MS3-6]|uniref:diguanylate cyclase domain-containing protein n=1 Tax=Agarivorans sp. TSD2052 TaxID=2937286 RepID=UPI00200E2761|nr:diguanylate cyclase [Agarivorans sp. TSD2052]UPW17645.1 diguanylate cyclase [Agarivorans sp. TSD2052]
MNSFATLYVNTEKGRGVADVDLVSFFHSIVETDSGYWLFQPNDDLVTVRYPWVANETDKMSLEQWLQKIDIRCRSAFQQAMHASLSNNTALVCHYCHSEDEWLRLHGMPVEIQQQHYLLASVLPLTMPVINDETKLRDPQSGLLSAPLFRELLIQAMRLSQRNHEPFAILTLHYSSNDSSLVCAIVAQVLQQQLRRSDSIAQYSDGELIALLYGASRAAANSVAEKLTLQLQQQLQGVSLDSLKVGWAYYPEHGDNVDTLLAHRLDSVELLSPY